MLQEGEIHIHYHGEANPLLANSALQKALFPHLDPSKYQPTLDEINLAREASLSSSMTFEEAIAATRMVGIAREFRKPSEPRHVAPVRKVSTNPS